MPLWHEWNSQAFINIKEAFNVPKTTLKLMKNKLVSLFFDTLLKLSNFDLTFLLEN